MVSYLMAEIMPRVWAQRPETRLIVVGKDPSSAVREYGRNPLVTITGTVEDIRPFLWRATASVVPLLYGAGIQNKILEAMATATPVVTTSRAVSAVGAIPGREILVSGTADGFASELLRLMADGGFRAAVGNAGLRYVQATHDWVTITSRLVEIYQQAQR
jgi:glycosyltransferase involved in cell wall biosynthesis